MVDRYFVQSYFKHDALRVSQILIRLSALSDILKFWTKMGYYLQLGV